MGWEPQQLRQYDPLISLVRLSTSKRTGSERNKACWIGKLRRVEEKPRRGRHRVGGGGSNRPRTTRPVTEKVGGVESSQDNSTPIGGRGGGGSSHGRMTRLHRQTEEESIRHGMTQPPEKAGAPRETKPQEPPQHPDPGGGKTYTGGGERTKTHPQPDQPRNSQPMTATERRHMARRRWGMRGRRRGWILKPKVRGIRQHTPPAQFRPRRR